MVQCWNENPFMRPRFTEQVVNLNQQASNYLLAYSSII